MFSGLNLKLGRWDSKRLYKIFDFAVVGEQFTELSDRYNVCLATQSSIEKIFSLVQMSHHWSGKQILLYFNFYNDEIREELF